MMLGKIEGRRSGQQRMRWLVGITDSMDMSLSKLWETVKVKCGMLKSMNCKESDTTASEQPPPHRNKTKHYVLKLHMSSILTSTRCHEAEKIPISSHLKVLRAQQDVCCCCCITSVMSNSMRPHRWQPTRLPHPWDSPGKSTGMGCHCLLCNKTSSNT